MKGLLSKTLALISQIMGKRNLEKLLIYSAKAIHVNLHLHGLVQIGALNGFNNQTNGEDFFVENILSKLLNNEVKPLLFDVGANVGNYALLLKKHFPKADIHAFEPVKSTFDTLAKNTAGLEIKIHNIGFSDVSGVGELYNTDNDANTELASVYKDVFAGVFKTDVAISPILFSMATLDTFCNENNIPYIDFLKIDVEGHELFVLKGAADLIKNNKIKVIQFEFNTHNIYSKVFLRDFYTALGDFNFYRLHQNYLISLGEYTTYNEIFTAQNIIAVHHSIADMIDSNFIKRYD